MNTKQTAEFIGELVLQLPDYCDAVRAHIADGQTFEQWRADFYTHVVDVSATLRGVFDRLEARGINRDELLHAIFTYTRENVPQGRA